MDTDNNVAKVGGEGGLGRGLTSRIVPTIKNKVRRTDSYNLENPRTSTFPKVTHVNQAIVPGDPWLRWEHSSGFTLSCCHWSSRHFSHFNDSLLLEQKRQPKNAFLFVFKHQIILTFFLSTKVISIKVSPKNIYAKLLHLKKIYIYISNKIHHLK